MLLSVRDLAKRFGGLAAVDGVSFELAAGETLALIGPSGCGKTTCLKMINRLVEPDRGEILLEGQEAHAVAAPDWRRRIGYVIQGAGLFPHMRVGDNVAVTMRLKGWPADRIAKRTAALLDMVALPAGAYARRWPTELSGGQRQRVGLARALAGEPDLVLMDEPFSALDALTKEQLIEDVAALRARLGFSAILVTHDFAEALRFADKIAVMETGRIVQIGTAADLIAAPASKAVTELLQAPRRSAEAVSAVFDGAGA